MTAKDNSSRKSVLFMAQLPPPVHGASLRNQSLVDSAAINARFSLTILPLKFISEMKELGKFSLRKIWLMAAYVWRLLGILATKKTDVAYFTMSPAGGAFYRDIVFIMFLKLFRKKRILHFRVKGIRQTASTRLGRSLVRYAFSKSRIVCLSQHHLQDMEGLLTEPPFIVPNGIKIETEYLHLSEQQPFNEVPRILFLSNLSVKKGVPELVKALHICASRGYQFTAHLVGNEWDLSFAQTKELIRAAGLEAVVFIEGPKYNREKFEQIAMADIFVFPTWFELFPGVILEAMQFGKAIVTTFEGSIPEMLDDKVNGILTENRNSDQLADGIAWFIDHPDQRAHMGNLAKEKFFREFTLEAFENNMCKVFDTVINSGS